MSAASFDLERPDHFTAGAVGAPGQRVFYLQAREGRTLCTLKSEKEQVRALGEYLSTLLERVPDAGDAPPASLALLEPVQEAWAVGTIGVGYDEASRRVVVGNDADLYTASCIVKDVNWIAIPDLDGEMRAEVKIRHKHVPAPATLCREGDGVRVKFDDRQRAVTPGQAAVFYQGDLVVGGGWIDGVDL